MLCNIDLTGAWAIWTKPTELDGVWTITLIDPSEVVKSTDPAGPWTIWTKPTEPERNGVWTITLIDPAELVELTDVIESTKDVDTELDKYTELLWWYGSDELSEQLNHATVDTLYTQYHEEQLNELKELDELNQLLNRQVNQLNEKEPF